MRLNFVAIAAAGIVLAPLASAQTAATITAPISDLYTRAMSPPATADRYAFDFIDETSGAANTYVKGHVDPSKPKGQRVTLVTVKGDKIDQAKLDAKYERVYGGDAAIDLWCDELGARIDGPAVEKNVSSAGRIFAVKPVARASAKPDERNLYKQLKAEVIIDEAKAVMRSFSARLPKPWKPNPFAKVTAAEFSGQCKLAPNGRAFVARTDMKLAGSAVTGPLDAVTSRTIENLTPVG